MNKKIKWFGESGVDPTWNNHQINDFDDYKQYIFDHISFVKIMQGFNLYPEQCSSGKYSHRMICPFKFHKNGREKTGSFRFSEKNKLFMCFGCCEGGGILRFLQLYRGGCEQYNLKKLAILAGLIQDNEIVLPDSYIIPEYKEQKENNYKILFDAGILLRNYINDLKDTIIYKNECEWADQMFVKIDKYFSMIDEENLEDAKKIYNNLNNSIKRRQHKRGM